MRKLENASGGGELVFGRVTYELMEAYWPTAAALEGDPVVAEHMNNLPKIVFSRTLDEASWKNTRLIDEYQVVLCPIALGSGRTMFQGAKGRLSLTLKKTRAFGDGNVVLWYEPRA